MRIPRSCSKLLCAGSIGVLALVFTSSVTAACAVWWQQKCCAKAGIDFITCSGVCPFQWRCEHDLVSDPAVGTITASGAGWDGPWSLGSDTCLYRKVSCGISCNVCIYENLTSSADCSDIGPPTTPPDCP
jgi:hypothetical protein